MHWHIYINLFKPDDKMKKILLLLLLLMSANMIQARKATPPPVINTNLTDDAFIITATGEGNVTLYVQYIDMETGEMTTESYEGEGTVTVEIPRGEEEDAYINYWATAQANEDAVPGTTEIEYFVEVPAKENPYPPDESHERGCWMVLRDRFGHEVWHNMDSYEAIAKLYYSVYGGFNPDTDERPFVPIIIVIDGIRYGAPSANTKVDQGNILENPLIESDNFYLISVGYKYNIGVSHETSSGELYLSAISVGYPLIYDEVSGEWVPEDPTQFITGDADGNAKVTISDVTIMIDYLLSGYSTGMNMDNADVDGSGKINIEDVTLLIDYLLKGSWW